MKTRFFQAEIKEVEIKEWMIKLKWYASTPDIDRYNDIVSPKAFKNAMELYMTNPVILLQHNWEKPIWKTVDFKLWRKGLNVDVEISNNIDNVFQNLSEWVLKWFSIWFIPKKWEYKMVWDMEIREITELELLEISVVSIPANPTSLFTLSKSLKGFFEDEANLINNKNIMDKEKEIVEEVKETDEDVARGEANKIEADKKEEKKDLDNLNQNVEESKDKVDIKEEVEEGTNIITPDEKEEADENSATDNEADENSEEVADDEAGLKDDVKALKEELATQKEMLSLLLDNFLQLSTEAVEMKGFIAGIPNRKGLATLSWVIKEEKQDTLVKELMNARNKF